MQPEPIIISNSEIQKFKRCKRAWLMAYYRKLIPIREDPTGPRSIGNRVHGVIAHYYELQMTVGADEAVEQSLSLHDWSVALDYERCPEDEDEIRKDADLSRAMVEGYFEWLETEAVDEGMKVVGIEEEVEHTMDIPTANGPVPVRIRGKLDLRVAFENPNGPEHEPLTLFLDHKTVQEFTTPTRALALDEQLLLYHWLLLWHPELPGGRVSGCIYNMIRKVKRSSRAKPPFYNRFEVRHNNDEIRSFHTRLVGELRDILELRAKLDAGADPLSVAYPSPNRNCSWDCDFYSVCNLMDRPKDKPDDYIARIFREGDPYARYSSEGQIV